MGVGGTGAIEMNSLPMRSGRVTFGPITALPGQMWPEGERQDNLSIWE